MGFLDNMKKYVRGDEYEEDELLTETVQDEESDEDPLEVDSVDKSSRSSKYKGRGFDSSAGEDAVSSRRSSYRDSDTRSNPANNHAASQLSVVLVKPERYENAAEIADHLMDKRTVVLNLEKTNRETARRLLDFLSGVAFANEGKIKRVANSTYIITPYNVDIQGNLIEERENNSMYM